MEYPADMLKSYSENEKAVAVYMLELYEGFCSHWSLEHLIDRMCSILGRPIILIDTGYKVLATSKGSEIFPQNMRSLLSNDQDVTEKKSISERAQSTVSCTVNIDTIEVAQLVIWKGSNVFDSDDFQLVKRFCSLISAHLQRMLLLNADRNQFPSYLLADLLDGKPIDESLADNKQHFLKWARTENIYIMAISGSGHEAFDNKLRVAFQVLKTFIPIEQCLIYQSTYVAFLDQILYDALFANPASGFCSFLEKRELFAGISSAFSVLAQSRKQYQNAMKAMEIGQKQKKNCIFFENCTLSIISEMLSARYEVTDLCHPAIMKLLAHDKEQGTDFVMTLKQYLYFASSPGKAAQKLNIHRNTLFYRIGKIKEMTGITLESGEEICKLFLSIRFLETNNFLGTYE